MEGRKQGAEGWQQNCSSARSRQGLWVCQAFMARVQLEGNTSDTTEMEDVRLALQPAEREATAASSLEGQRSRLLTEHRGT